MVVFSSLEFLFRFLPIFLAVYYLTPPKHKDAILFMGSILFYAAGEPLFVILLLGMTILNYAFGWLGQRFASNVPTALCIILDAGVLILCKILALKVDDSFLPLGMSFYIFKMISWQADVCRGEIQKLNFIKTAAYFTMFPQVTQGPIMRYKDGGFEEDGPRHIRISRLEDGLILLVMGLGMKVLLADRIGILWNEIDKIGYESISTPLAWMGAFAYTFQLYFDFWGYSLMAAGIGMMLGFPFVLNFDHPYSARGIADFYRRWHVTLGAWFKDYLYIPMGGSRKGKIRTVLNLLIVWLVTGLWHGGTVNFLLWGIVLGFWIIVEKFPLRGVMEKYPLIGRLHVWILIPLTWVIFAISDLEALGVYFTRLFPFFGTPETVYAGDFLKYAAIYWPFFLAAVLLCQPVICRKIAANRRRIPMLLVLTVIFWISLYFSAISSGNAFLYFSF